MKVTDEMLVEAIDVSNLLNRTTIINHSSLSSLIPGLPFWYPRSKSPAPAINLKDRLLNLLQALDEFIFEAKLLFIVNHVLFKKFAFMSNLL